MERPIPVRARTRHEIVGQAMRLVAANGYDATSLQDIASAVGCSKAAVLYHFPSKAALFAAAMAPAVEAATALVREVRALPAELRQGAAIAGLADLAVRFRSLAALLPEVFPSAHAHQELADLMPEARHIPELLLDPADPDSAAMVTFALAGLSAFSRRGSLIRATPDGVLENPEGLDDEALRRTLTAALTRLLVPPTA